MANEGYSGTPLIKKLGIKDGYKIKIINQPENYFQLFEDFPQNVIITDDKELKKNLIHFFTKEEAQLIQNLPDLKDEIEQNGIIWVSWPKKSSKIRTDMTEDSIRNLALKIGLVDVKVCAVNEIWSGLKLVIPAKNRMVER